jgi:hypothetical protein
MFVKVEQKDTKHSPKLALVNTLLLHLFLVIATNLQNLTQ